MKPIGLTLVVRLVEQLLAIPAAIALFLVSRSAWWLLVVLLPLAPGFLLDLASRLEVISDERQANAKETNRGLLKALIVVLAFVAVVGMMNEVFG